MAGTGGSRRHLTIAFCDLVSSTALLERHDPEVVRDVLLAYNEACAAIVKRYGGRIARFLGDGLLVCFGHPVAHEDDARRAILAALEMTQAVARLREQVLVDHGVSIALRVGVDSGVVVVAETAGGEWREPDDLVGPAVNVAARIQTEAQPNAVVISGSTLELVRGYFETRSLGCRTLRGISEPVELLQVLGPSTAQTRLEASARRTPLVGRQREREFLSAAWAQAAEGAAGTVVIEGEAGIGKSRLVEWLTEIAQTDAQRVTLQCSPYHQDSPLYPAARLLERAAGAPPSDDAHRDTKRGRRLRAFLDRAGPTPLTDLVLLCRLGSVPPPPDLPVPALHPEQERERTFAALLDWTERLAGTAPVLIVVEDLHWADPSTVDLLNRAIARQSARHRLLVITTRPGHRERLTGDIPVLVVEPLTVDDGREMLARIDEAQQIPTDVCDLVAERSGGVPLFIEELARMLVGAEGVRAKATVDDVVVPPTLHDLLTARIEQLPAEKPLAQILATIGQAATAELIQLVQPMDSDRLETHLQNLEAAGIVRMELSSGRTMYAFRHALIRDATYQSQLHAQRRPLHNRIADVLLDHFPETGERRPEILAHHFEHGGRLAGAADYWYRAGVLSAARAAHAEAVSQFARAIDLLARLSPTEEHLELELAAQLGLGVSNMAVRGYAATQTQQAYARAVELAERRGGSRVDSLFGLWAYYVVRGDHSLALRLALRCMAAAAPGGVGQILEAHAIVGYQRLYGGELVEARRHLAEASTLGAEQASSTFPHDIGAASLAGLALTLWLLGSPAEARSAMAESLARADALDFPLGPFTRAYTYTYAACFEQLMGDPHASASCANRAIGIALEHGFPTWALAGSLHLAIANGTTGSPAEALAVLAPGIATWRGAGAELFIPYFQAWMAELQRRSGDLAAALDTVEDAIRSADSRAERFYQPELLRLRGDLRAEMNPAARAEAEADYRAAIALATAQHAVPFELRAAVSFHRSRLSQGRGDESEAVLARIVERVPAGAETPDLAAALAALELIRS